jgi:hypothetical protein
VKIIEVQDRKKSVFEKKMEIFSSILSKKIRQHTCLAFFLSNKLDIYWEFILSWNRACGKVVR